MQEHLYVEVIKLLLGALATVCVATLAFYVRLMNETIKDIKEQLHIDRKILFEHINNNKIHINTN